MESRVYVAAHNSNPSTQEVKTGIPWSRLSSYTNQMSSGRPCFSKSSGEWWRKTAVITPRPPCRVLRCPCTHAAHIHVKKRKEMPAGTWLLLLLELLRFPTKEPFFFFFFQQGTMSQGIRLFVSDSLKLYQLFALVFRFVFLKVSLKNKSFLKTDAARHWFKSVPLDVY